MDEDIVKKYNDARREYLNTDIFRQYGDILVGPTTKEIISLKYGLDDGQQKSIEEVAKMMEMPVGRVRITAELGMVAVGMYIRYIEEKVLDTSLSNIDANTVKADLTPVLKAVSYKVTDNRASKVVDIINYKKEQIEKEKKESIKL